MSRRNEYAPSRHIKQEDKPLFEIERNTATGPDKQQVLRVGIFKRDGSRYYQALIRFDVYRKRISTHNTHPGSARQFAELAYKHFDRLARRGELQPTKRKGAKAHE